MIFNSWKPDSQTEITKKLIQNGATYLANRLNQDVTTMNLRDIIQVLDFVINDFHHFENFENIPPNVKKGIKLVKDQAVVLKRKVLVYTEKHEDAEKIARQKIDDSLP